MSKRLTERYTQILKIIDDSILVDNVTLCVGKDYLGKIINRYVKDDLDYSEKLNNLVSSFNNYKYIDNFELLYPEVFDVMFSEIEDITKELRWIVVEEEDFHWYLMKHIQNVLPKLENDIKRGIAHSFFTIQPYRIYKSHVITDETSDIDENNIICKLNAKKYLKNTDRNDNGADAWTYQLCVLYIILIETLYRILEPVAKNDIKQFLIVCFTELHPIIVGITATVQYRLEGMNAVDVLHELMQLTTYGKHLLITKNPSVPSVTFTYRTLEGNFLNISNIERTYKPLYYKSPYRDDKSGKRYASVKVYGNDNLLNLRLTFIGLGILDEVTDMVADSALFSLLYDEVTLFEFGYMTLSTMLKHTAEAKNKLNTIVSDDTNLAIRYLIDEYGLKENAVSYAIVANELSNVRPELIPSILSTYFKPTDTRQKALLNKMIRDVREIRALNRKPVLKYLYKTFNHSVGVD